MIIIDLLHFLFGYVVFAAQGGFPERFINLCPGMKIPVWDLKHRGNTLYGKTTIGGYLSIRPLARKSGMKVRIVRRVGVPFFMHKYRRRAGLLAGLAVFIIFISVMSQMIWVVKVEGNYSVSDEVILSAFEELGVKPGMRASSIKSTELERAALEKLKALSWVAVNRDGSSVTIEVREKLKTEDSVDTRGTYHVVASEDGVIRILEVYEGTAKLKIGSAVGKGDLIISGIKENRDTSVTFHHARGYVAAEVKSVITSSVQKKQSVLKISSANKKISVSLFGKKLPSRKGIEKSFYASDRWLSANRVALPLGYTLYRSTEYTAVKYEYSADEACLLALRGYFKQLAARHRYSDEINKKVTVHEDSVSYTITGEYTMLKNIGSDLEFWVEDGIAVTDERPEE